MGPGMEDRYPAHTGELGRVHPGTYPVPSLTALVKPLRASSMVSGVLTPDTENGP